MEIDEILFEAEGKMQKTEEVLVHDYSGVRTGKASPGLVENLMVDMYESKMRLCELAGISTPESRMIVIQPWDQGALHPIEKAIMKSELGLNPSIDQKLIRIVLPELSEERRIEFTKIVKKMTEDARISIRHIRRDALEHLKVTKKSGVPEDDIEKAEKEVQKLTDKYVANLDVHLGKKETDIMKV
ncbi:MAG TPA: ribosome recycling factor [Verrucomicrobiales bacterium]|nr:ribosome recycling factor [Verrucomicrobiales bacterium]